MQLQKVNKGMSGQMQTIQYLNTKVYALMTRMTVKIFRNK